MNTGTTANQIIEKYSQGGETQAVEAAAAAKSACSRCKLVVWTIDQASSRGEWTGEMVLTGVCDRLSKVVWGKDLDNKKITRRIIECSSFTDVSEACG